MTDAFMPAQSHPTELTYGSSEEINAANAPIFLEYQDALAEIDKLSCLLAAELDAHANAEEYVPAYTLYLALRAQARTIDSLNGEMFRVPVPWDSKSGFPLPSALAADAGSYAKHMEGDMRSLLNSFRSWTSFQRKEILCCCGGVEKLRLVEFEVMLQHAVRIDGARFSIKEYAGVRSPEKAHLAQHYGIKEKSKTTEGLMIIWMCENILYRENTYLHIEQKPPLRAPEFYLQEFARRIRALLPLI